MGLMRHSPTSRRILWATDEVRDSGISEILGTIWQSETLQHLNTGLEGAHASRLSKVWTKLKIWEVPCCEEVPCSSRAYLQSPLWRVEACLLQMESSDAESSLEALNKVCAIDPDSVKPGNFDFTPHVEERTAKRSKDWEGGRVSDSIVVGMGHEPEAKASIIARLKQMSPQAFESVSWSIVPVFQTNQPNSYVEYFLCGQKRRSAEG